MLQSFFSTPSQCDEMRQHRMTQTNRPLSSDNMCTIPVVCTALHCILLTLCIIDYHCVQYASSQYEVYNYCNDSFVCAAMYVCSIASIMWFLFNQMMMMMIMIITTTTTDNDNNNNNILIAK